MAEQDDAVFAQEQQHLTETYAKLLEIEAQANERFVAGRDDAQQDLADLLDEMVLDFSEVDHALETLVELEAANAVVAGYNLANDAAADRLRRARQLLRKPYFAKVSLRFKPGAPVRDVYLGSAGMTDETYRHFIIDWRSPVAEVYYNQENGHTGYDANGRWIDCELTCRRQFDLDRDQLHACFDTTVAIEDPLLLQSLAGRRGAKMGAITATIQREQNAVIRAADAAALLVEGIAGSGKTSVLLQRIAYLLYRRREDLDPDQVYLLSPNPVFGRYIDNVLPDMGERNPHIFTWHEFLDKLGLAGRGEGAQVTEEVLYALEQAMDALQLTGRDFREIAVGDMVLLRAQAVGNAALKVAAKHPLGPRWAALVCEELHDKLDSRLAQLAASEAVRDEMLALDIDEQVDIFGSALIAADDEQIPELARTYVEHLYGSAHDAIEDACWLRIDRIAMRMLGAQSAGAVEWLYTKLLLTGMGNRDARYVMVDEVQDYTTAQLLVLARWFSNAHFMLLGDGNQAIKPGTATFADVRAVFERARGQVEERRLMTSYRSTPQVTALFAGLLPHGAHLQVNSVQPDGVEPVVQQLPAQGDEWLGAVRAAAEEAQRAVEAGGLAAVVCADRARARWLAGQLGEDALLLDGAAVLPECGLVVCELSLAKGLEFDCVVIPDAQAAVYGDDALSRRRLYTAVSRATKRVTILSQGAMTPLLQSSLAR